MTKRGKCDICRARKVKCDQKRPCGACSKKRRPCTYAAAASFEESASCPTGARCFSLSRQGNAEPLALAHSTSSEHGEFLTFLAARSTSGISSTARLLSNDESRRAASWTGMIRESSSSWSWWDRFVSLVTVRIGSDPTIDRAIDFTLESYTTYKHEWDDACDQVAQKRGLSAIATLRQALEANYDQKIVAITTGLFCVAELFRAVPGVWSYYVHMEACAKLLASSGKDGCVCELEETLLYFIVLEEVDHAMIRRRRSVFAVRPIPPLKRLAKYGASDGYVDALSTIMNLLIRLSHLALLVQDHTQDGQDRILTLKIVNMIQSLWEADDDVKIVLEMESDSRAVPTEDDAIANILPLSYTFRSNYDFDLAIHYLTYRALLCGLIQVFYNNLRRNESTDTFDFLDINAVREEDENNSRRIAMCIKYSQQTPDAPCVPLRFNTALKHGYGSLKRIQVRQAVEGHVQKSVEAAGLARLCYENGIRTLWMWGVPTDVVPSEEYFGSHYETVMGGPQWQQDKYFDEEGLFKPEA